MKLVMVCGSVRTAQTKYIAVCITNLSTSFMGDVLCIPQEQKVIISVYTGWPKNGSVDFLGLCSDQQLSFSPCWIEHLFLIVITPRSSHLVEFLYIL